LIHVTLDVFVLLAGFILVVLVGDDFRRAIADFFIGGGRWLI
jgi:hypothetical protein